MRLLGLDVETTGLKPETDLITEVGLVLWETDRHAPLVVQSFYLNWAFLENDNFIISEEVTKATGIRREDCLEFGKHPLAGLGTFHELASSCEAIVAHNGELFDRLFVNSWQRRISAYQGFSVSADEKLWVDTQNDLDFPEEMVSRKLTYLAADHGFLNPFAHRAVFDVLTMMRILDRYDPESYLHSARQPTVVLQALVSYDDRELAKERRFRWDSPKKRWIRSIKKHKIEAERFPFPVQEVML